jgi:NADH dehydrogenase FAD-containing subunit
MEQIATKSPCPRVVIVRAGFRCLAAAKRLARRPVDVTIIDKRNYHLFQPLPGATLFRALIRQHGVFPSMAGRWSR